MTQLLTRPVLRVETSAPVPRRSLVGSAALAAVVAACGGLVLTVAVSVSAWFAADSGSFGAAVRVGALSWLVGQGGGLHVAGASITVVPLGGCALAAWLLHRAGRWAGSGAPSAPTATLAVACGVLATCYGAVALLVLAGTHTGGVHADLFRTALVPASLALVAGGFGVVRGAGMTRVLVNRLPYDLRLTLAGAAAGGATMVFASAVLLTTSLVIHFSSAVSLADTMPAGLVGGAVLALLGASVVPNAILCSGAYLTGAGFSLGEGTTVAPHLVSLGPIPAFPLLTALPSSGGSWQQTTLVATPLLAGAVTGAFVVLKRRCRGYAEAVLRAGAAGLTGGAIFGASTWLATGALGRGRLHHIGPDVAATAFLSVVALCLGAASSGLVAWWVTSRRPSKSEPTEDSLLEDSLKDAPLDRCPVEDPFATDPHEKEPVAEAQGSSPAATPEGRPVPS